MMKESKLKFAVAIVESRTHKAVGGKRCGCGPCAHWVALAARWAGVPRKRLVAELPLAAKPERRRPRPQHKLRARICDSGTVRVRGRDIDPQEGLAILLSRICEPG